MSVRHWQYAMLSLVAAGMVLVNMVSARAVLGSSASFSKRPLIRLLASAAAIDPGMLEGGLRIDPGALAHRSGVAGDGLEITIPRGETPVLGSVDVLSIDREGRSFVAGWVFSPDQARRIAFVVMVANGRVLSVAPVDRLRADVANALGLDNARRSGFEAVFTSIPGITPCMTKVYAVDAALSTQPLPHSSTACPR